MRHRPRPRAHRLFADGVCVRFHPASNRCCVSFVCSVGTVASFSRRCFSSLISSKALFGVESNKFKFGM